MALTRKKPKSSPNHTKSTDLENSKVDESIESVIKNNISSYPEEEPLTPLQNVESCTENVIRDQKRIPIYPVPYGERPPNAFQIWWYGMRNEIQKTEGTDCSTRRLGAVWSKLSEEEQRPYREKAYKLLKEYKETFPESLECYKPNLDHHYARRPHPYMIRQKSPINLKRLYLPNDILSEYRKNYPNSFEIVAENWKLSEQVPSMDCESFIPTLEDLESAKENKIVLETSPPYPKQSTVSYSIPATVGTGPSANELLRECPKPSTVSYSIPATVDPGPSADELWTPYLKRFAEFKENTVSYSMPTTVSTRLSADKLGKQCSKPSTVSYSTPTTVSTRPSAYELWKKTKGPMLKTQNNEKLCLIWKNMTIEEKAPFLEECQKLLLEHRQGPPKVVKPLKKPKPKPVRQVKNPKNPYIIAKREEQVKTENQVEFCKEHGAIWKNLSPEDKKPYVERSKRLKEEYKKNHSDGYKQVKVHISSPKIYKPFSEFDETLNFSTDLENIEPTFFVPTDYPWEDALKSIIM